MESVSDYSLKQKQKQIFESLKSQLNKSKWPISLSQKSVKEQLLFASGSFRSGATLFCSKAVLFCSGAVLFCSRAVIFCSGTKPIAKRLTVNNESKKPKLSG